MIINYEIRDENVYKIVDTGSTIETYFLGGAIITETVRIDAETVADVTYKFDLDAGEYVEQSRVERHEPLPPPEPTPEERIAQLENELLQTKLALAELAEANEQDKTYIQLALAELAEIIAGGDE